MVYGSFVVAGIAIILAGILGVSAAIFVSVYAPRRLRLILKSLLELLAAVPSVVYGLLGVYVVRNIVMKFMAFLEVSFFGDSLLTGGVLLAIMILPLVTTLSEDVLSSFPPNQTLAARSLGLTTAEVTWFLILPRAFPGIVAVLLLGLARAFGETVAVFLVVGRQDSNLPSRLSTLSKVLEPGQTLTTKLGSGEVFIAQGDQIHWSALMVVALILTVLASLISVSSQYILRKLLSAHAPSS